MTMIETEPTQRNPEDAIMHHETQIPANASVVEVEVKDTIFDKTKRMLEESEGTRMDDDLQRESFKEMVARTLDRHESIQAEIMTIEEALRQNLVLLGELEGRIDEYTRQLEHTLSEIHDLETEQSALRQEFTDFPQRLYELNEELPRRKDAFERYKTTTIEGALESLSAMETLENDPQFVHAESYRALQEIKSRITELEERMRYVIGRIGEIGALMPRLHDVRTGHEEVIVRLENDRNELVGATEDENSKLKTAVSRLKKSPYPEHMITTQEARSRQRTVIELGVKAAPVAFE